MISKILHIVFASFFLISTMGMSINMHYCHDQLIDLAFNSPAHSCCDINENGASQFQDSCPGCQDETIVIEPGDDYEVSTLVINLENYNTIDLFLITEIFNSIQGIDESTKNVVPRYKKPPPYQEVVLSQIQSYLI